MGASDGRGNLDHPYRGRAATLHGGEHRVLPDRIETGAYAMAVAATGGELTLQARVPISWRPPGR
ncbi:MAG: hypothetical protein R3C58_08290 [Parvularculaceae bacterium]